MFLFPKECPRYFPHYCLNPALSGLPFICDCVADFFFFNAHRALVGSGGVFHLPSLTTPQCRAPGCPAPGWLLAPSSRTPTAAPPGTSAPPGRAWLPAASWQYPRCWGRTIKASPLWGEIGLFGLLMFITGGPAPLSLYCGCCHRRRVRKSLLGVPEP